MFYFLNLNSYYLQGILQNVTLSSQTLINWTMTPVLLDPQSLNRIRELKYPVTENQFSVPAIFSTKFELKGTILDTFLNLEGWHKVRIKKM